MFEHPWSAVYLIGFVVYVATRHVYEKRVRGVATSKSEVDLLEKGLLVLVMVGALLIPLL